jgi:putative sigma-54 modulation protein
LPLTDGLKQRIEEKFNRIKRHHDDLNTVSVTLSVDKLDHAANIHTHYAGAEQHVKASSSDMYVAIDEAMDKFDRLLLKMKTKQTVKRHDEMPLAHVG